MVPDQAEDEIKQIAKKSRKHKQLKSEFKHLSNIDRKNFQAEFVLAQAKEVCKYLFRLHLIPFKAWESFLIDSMNKNKEVFLYDFYLKENEFGEIEPDIERIQTLVLDDEVEDPLFV